MISVIMPVWNGAKFMDKAIASVVAQTQSEWELLIVDDGSTDDSLTRAERWQDMVNNHMGAEKIRVFSIEVNSGPSVARNLAAQHARYDIFAYLDVDDIFFSRRIESLLPLFDRYDLVFSPIAIVREERIGLFSIRNVWEAQSNPCNDQGDREPPFEVWVRSRLQVHCDVSPLAVAHRRELFEKVGGFQPGLIFASDAVLWRRMVDRGARIGLCPVLAGWYYVRADGQFRGRRRFAAGGFEIQPNHPMGRMGQYLDAEWFANLEKKKVVSGE
jgi:glycosyltransferase involved in cell wall biosynthesis